MNWTKIEYLDYTWNPTHGCSPISEGCRNCWAKRQAKRLSGIFPSTYNPNHPFKPTFNQKKLNDPAKVKKPSRIGVSFMGDLFHEDVPDKFIDKVLEVMIKQESCHHNYLILTKRPRRMLEYCYSLKEEIAPDGVHISQVLASNLWFGVSVEDQKTADERIPILLQTPAQHRFVSVEPMLGEVDISYYLYGCPEPYGDPENPEWEQTCNILDWGICGAEAGTNKRECKYEWSRNLKNQFVKAHIPFFYKQGLGDDGKWHKMPVLDCQVWDQMPEGLKSEMV